MTITRDNIIEVSLKVIEVVLEICGAILLVWPLISWIIG